MTLVAVMTVTTVCRVSARGRDTVATVLAGHAARTPDAPFLVTEDGQGGTMTVTYAEMDRRAARTAGAGAALWRADLERVDASDG